MTAPPAATSEAGLDRRIGVALAGAATAFFALVVLWESHGVLDCGHNCAPALVAIAGENILKYKIFGAVETYVRDTPPPVFYYTNHPLGLFFSSAFAHALFGHQPFSVRAPAVFYSAFTPPLLFAIARRLWGWIPAGLAAIVFVLVPIDLAFAQFSSLEVVTIFWGLVLTWGTVRAWEEGRPRYLAASFAGAVGLCNADWVGFVLASAVAGLAIWRAYVLPRRWIGPVLERAHARWLALVVAAVGLTALAYLYSLQSSDRLMHLLGQYRGRSTGSELPFTAVFSQRRRMWLDWLLPDLALWPMAAAFLVAAVRLVRPRPQDIVLFAWVAAAAFQYFMFKQGADIHIFWPHYFGPCVALAAGSIAAGALRAGELAKKWAPRVAARPKLALVAKGVLALAAVAYCALLGRVGLAQLRQARLTSGRFDESGNYIGSDRDEATFVRWASAGLEERFDLALVSFTHKPHLEYHARRPLKALGALGPSSADDPGRVAIVDTRQAPAAELKRIARGHAVTAVGPFWRVDRAEAPRDLEALAFEDRPPTAIEWFWRTGTDRVYAVGGPDPWATWGWRDALDLPRDDREPGEPATVEQVRLARNMAASRGDEARARALDERLAGMLDNASTVRFTGGVSLAGWRMERGGSIVAWLYWRTDASFAPADAEFYVRGKVTAPPAVWPSAVDYFEKEVAPRGSAKVSLWKPDRVYAQRFVVLHRVGHEEYTGAFSTPALRPESGHSPAGIKLFSLD